MTKQQKNNPFWKYAWWLALFVYISLSIYGLSNNLSNLRLIDIAMWGVIGISLFSFFIKPHNRKAKVYLVYFLSMIIFLFGSIFIFEKTKIPTYTLNLFHEKPYLGKTLLSFIFLVAFVSTILIFYVFIKSSFIRPKQFKKLAAKYNLHYSRGTPTFEGGIGSTVMKRNIIEGEINKKKIAIYNSIDKYGYPMGISAFSRRATIIEIDGKKEECRGKFYGLCSVARIEEILKNKSNR